MASRYRKDGTLCPSYDPNSPHPGSVFYGGVWRTPDHIANAREYSRKWKKENPEKAREHRRKWAKENPEKVREMSRNARASGRPSETRELCRRKAIKEGKCVSCSRPAVSGLIVCETCQNKRSESQRLRRHFGMSVTIIRELGLDKNLPAPRRENADR